MDHHTRNKSAQSASVISANPDEHSTACHSDHAHHSHGGAGDTLEAVAGITEISGGSGTEVSTEYTCPMHPEIRQETPGLCPKCGMTLEPVMPTGDTEEGVELRDFRRRLWWTLPLTVLVT
ncbi:MAG: heavy metal-binding domain-containing protein, partial [Burkholderiaceae bacterium]